MKSICILDEININQEFKRVVEKITGIVDKQIKLAQTEKTLTNKLALLELSYMLISLIQNSYQDNEDYQLLIKFYQDEIEDYREVFIDKALDNNQEILH